MKLETKMRTLISPKVILLTVVFVLANTSICAQDDPTFGSRGGAKSIPVSSVLNPDGSVKRGSLGSYDTKGFRMVTGKDESPHFVADNGVQNSTSLTTDCSDGWDDRFGTNGPDGYVDAIAVDADGNVYIGGGFSFVGNVPASRIAKWNGSSWSALASGLTHSGGYNASVRAIAILGTDVYVGGVFSSAGGNPANNIAKWNGSSWSALGSGVSGTYLGAPYVSAIGIAGTDIYVGGAFMAAGGVAGTMGIAKWDGSNWSALGLGVPVVEWCWDDKSACWLVGGAAVMATSGTDVYVAEDLSIHGGSPADSILKWNGSSWSALGSGVGGYVSAIAISGTDVYIGGGFTNAGGIPASGIAKWNGSNWSALGSGVPAAEYCSDDGHSCLILSVYAISVSGTDVYVGGGFTNAGGIPASGIAKWNGSSWSPLGSGTHGYFFGFAVSGPVSDLAISGSDLYAGGGFSTAGCHAASNFSHYDLSTALHKTPFDFDGDGRADVSVFRPSSGTWFISGSQNGLYSGQFGLSTDVITPADFDGDGKTDAAVFRDGDWWILRSSDSAPEVIHFGQSGDIPVPADYTGDGRSELAIYRDGQWWLLDLSNGQVSVLTFGLSTDKPVVADYDGDGKADQAVYRNGEWHLNLSSSGYRIVQFGLSTDKPLIGDFDGDGKSDPAVYRDGVWYVLQSAHGFTACQFGLPSDIPVPADYDGDGKTDLAVFRNGQWWIRQSTNGISVQQFGLMSDNPAPGAYLP